VRPGSRSYPSGSPRYDLRRSYSVRNLQILGLQRRRNKERRRAEFAVLRPRGSGTSVGAPTFASILLSWLSPHRRTAEPAWDDGAFGEASRGLFWEADSAWRRYRRLHRAWTAFHYVLGSASVVLAAASGFGSLSELLDPKQAAVVALGSAVVGALATFFGSDKRRSESAAMASAWDSFRDDISIVQLKRRLSPSEAIVRCQYTATARFRW
jgi:hypothetical protein